MSVVIITVDVHPEGPSISSDYPEAPELPT